MRVFDSVERTREMNMIMTALKTLVGLVGGIALFVGAVGVMNIMIVSVTQRTSEIGLRRAVGARASWIRRQFLIESVLVTSVGGVRRPPARRAPDVGRSTPADRPGSAASLRLAARPWRSRWESSC